MNSLGKREFPSVDFLSAVSGQDIRKKKGSDFGIGYGVEGNELKFQQKKKLGGEVWIWIMSGQRDVNGRPPACSLLPEKA